MNHFLFVYNGNGDWVWYPSSLFITPAFIESNVIAVVEFWKLPFRLHQYRSLLSFILGSFGERSFSRDSRPTCLLHAKSRDQTRKWLRLSRSWAPSFCPRHWRILEDVHMRQPCSSIILPFLMPTSTFMSKKAQCLWRPPRIIVWS